MFGSDMKTGLGMRKETDEMMGGYSHTVTLLEMDQMCSGPIIRTTQTFSPQIPCHGDFHSLRAYFYVHPANESSLLPLNRNILLESDLILPCMASNRISQLLD